ncbi:MAG TPA: molybdopterin cofactor-binding domain-containing protein [Candidatus Dormibacteraeota bacterium]|jgi:nicotinate dehydrogenase subunit B|nr:molybdopterin cofactor-binding domain-containing protein [Candidatus Dormibacteraeota bacterium]
MNEHATVSLSIEPERYELREARAYVFELTRRDLFKFLGAGALFFCANTKTIALQESGRGQRRGDDMPKDIGAWLHIGEDGKITVFTGKVEVGQNIRTSLAQAVAEELHAPVSQIELVMGDTLLTPYDMGTFGSRTTPTMNLQLRKVSAAACDLLKDIAAKNWSIERDRLAAANGKIVDPISKNSATYGELLKGREIAQIIPDQDPLLPATEWRVAGKSLAKADGRDFVTGVHKYPSDQKLPGMLYGKVVRPSKFQATLISADTTAAEKMPGVIVVRDGDFIGVAAPSEEIASQAAAAIKTEWKAEPQPSSKNIFDYLRKNPERRESTNSPADQGAQATVRGSGQQLLATYTVEYIAHAPLEPRAALAEWEGDKLTVWTGTQRPFGVREELAAAFHIPQESVHVLMPDTGSAYGGKHTGETAIEAARLARAAKKPVKVVWTRKEEFTWAYFRPAGVIDIRASVDSSGRLEHWEFTNFNSGGSGLNTPYAAEVRNEKFQPTKYPLRQGSYRGLAATANHFARESFMDELAHQAKMDPLEFRRKNLKDERLRAVLEAAAKKFGWPGVKKSSEQGFGIAGGFEKGGYVATCAEVTVDRSSGSVRVARLVTAFECGAIVNPDGLRNQVEGANIMGLGGALFEAIEFEDGRILNAAFSKYRVPRFKDVPAIETVLIDRKDLPSAGAGETPIVGVAPAIGNAIFNATGVRLRSLPMVPNGLRIS